MYVQTHEKKCLRNKLVLFTIKINYLFYTDIISFHRRVALFIFSGISNMFCVCEPYIDMFYYYYY